MRSADIARSAGQAIAATPMRSALTALGVIIGVGAVIMMLAIGAGAQRAVEESIARLGSNLLFIQAQSNRASGAASSSDNSQGLTFEDAEAIKAEIQGLAAVDASIRAGVQVVAPTANWATGAEGVTPDHFVARNWDIAQGRFLDEDDLRGARKVVVLGQTVAEGIFGDSDPIGQRIRINRTPFEVIGVTAPKGQSNWGTDQDDTLFVPLSTARMRLTGRGGRGDQVRRITVSVERADDMDRAVADIEELLRVRHRIRPGEADDFSVRNLSAIVESRNESTRTFTILLAAVAAVSLLVGGIGIMNIMLVSVTERTREIGLRMALGAKRGDILSQFALESVVLSMAGGLIGAALGVGGSLAIANIGDWELVLQPASVFMAFGFAALVGLIFGIYPARRAAQLDPIEALRRE